MSRIAAILLLVLVPGLANGQVVFDLDFSGAIAKTMVDLDDAGGETAFIGQFGGTSSLGGTFTAQAMLEALPADVAVHCDPGELEAPLYRFSFVQRLDAGGILVFYNLDPVATNYVCIDEATGLGHGTATLLIEGGTGPADGAGGWMVLEFSFRDLMAGASEASAHSAVWGSASGEISPP